MRGFLCLKFNAADQILPFPLKALAFLKGGQLVVAGETNVARTAVKHYCDGRVVASALINNCVSLSGIASPSEGDDLISPWRRFDFAVDATPTSPYYSRSLFLGAFSRLEKITRSRRSDAEPKNPHSPESV